MRKHYLKINLIFFVKYFFWIKNFLDLNKRYYLIWKEKDLIGINFVTQR